jgi:hypothetical protein
LESNESAHAWLRIGGCESSGDIAQASHLPIIDRDGKFLTAKLVPSVLIGLKYVSVACCCAQDSEEMNGTTLFEVCGVLQNPSANIEFVLAGQSRYVRLYSCSLEEQLQTVGCSEHKQLRRTVYVRLTTTEGLLIYSPCEFKHPDDVYCEFPWEKSLEWPVAINYIITDALIHERDNEKIEVQRSTAEEELDTRNKDILLAISGTSCQVLPDKVVVNAANMLGAQLNCSCRTALSDETICNCNFGRDLEADAYLRCSSEDRDKPEISAIFETMNVGWTLLESLVVLSIALGISLIPCFIVSVLFICQPKNQNNS